MQTKKYRADTVQLSNLWLNLDMSAFTPVHLYADAVNGDDENDGLTALTPVKTLMTVLFARVPALPPPQVIIHLAEGTYSDFPASLFGGGFMIVGPNPTPGFTGTPDSCHIKDRTLTFTGAGWTPSEHKGKLLHCTHWENSAYGDMTYASGCVAIVDNTSDTLTLACPYDWIVTTYEIDIVSPVAVIGSGSGGVNTTGSQIGMIKVDLSGASANAPMLNYGGLSRGCQFIGSSATGSQYAGNAFGCAIIDFTGHDNNEYQGLDSCYVKPTAGFWLNGKVGGFLSDSYFEGNGVVKLTLDKRAANFQIKNRCVFDNLPLRLERFADVIIDEFSGGAGGAPVFKNAFEAAITVNTAKLEIYKVIEGTGNATVGMDVKNGAQVALNGNVPTLTGTSGDFTTDNGLTILDWSTDVPHVDLDNLARVYLYE